MSLIRPGVTMIDIDEVVDYLNEDKIISIDTKNVSGEKADNMAISALDEDGKAITFVNQFGDVIPSRNTVKNSLMLGGLSYNDYLNKIEAETLNKFAENISEIYSKQIKNLREELYNTKAELERRGYIQNTGLLDGMFDNFNENILKINTHSTKITENLATSSNNVIPVERPGIFVEGDFVAIVAGIENPFENETFANDTTRCYVSKVVEVTGTSIRIDIPVPALSMADTKVFKSLGTYSGGNMFFSKVSTNVVSDERMQLTLLDDTNYQIFSIAKPRTGLATSFRIPPHRSGAIDSFVLKGRVIGNPGDMICYLIEEKNIEKFANIEMVNENDSDPTKEKIILARSQPISFNDSFEDVQYASVDNCKFFEFNFRDTVTGKLPIVKTSRDDSYEENKRHCFIIMCESASESNKWDIIFTSGENGEDYNTTANSYRFEEKDRVTASNNIVLGIKNDALKLIENFDMNYILNTRRLEPQKRIPYNRGLYNATIRNSNKSEFSTARLSLRVLREGLFRAKGESEGIYMGSTTINMDRNTPGSRTAMLLSEKVIVGENEVLCSNSSIDSLSFDTVNSEPIRVNFMDKIYRNGYKVQLKAIKNRLLPVTESPGRYIEVPEVIKFVDMELKSIIKDYPLELDERYSDRLIYECETEDLDKFDTFELQIAWKTSLEVEDIINNQDFEGGIAELTFSLGDVIYNK